MTLNQRQAKILEGVCQEYIKQALPIGSEVLKEKQELPFSPATIRAELFLLEKKHYLFHPYISSGRVPTDKGFRFFVDSIMEKGEWDEFNQETISEMFSQLEDLNDLLKLSHKLTENLSRASSSLILTYLPEENVFWKEGWEFVLQEPEFQSSSYWQKFFSFVSDFEKNIDKFDWQKGKIKVCIGKENPCKPNEMSVVMTKSSIGKEIEEMIAILGPKRMDFRKNIGLLSKVNGVLENFYE